MGKYRAPLLNNDVIHLVDRNKEPEQKLWIAVLAKAFDDAFYSADERSALDALSWIKHGSNFNYVCGLAGRDPNYVRKKMLNKVIEREAVILQKHNKIKNVVSFVPKPKRKRRTKNKRKKPKPHYRFKKSSSKNRKGKPVKGKKDSRHNYKKNVREGRIFSEDYIIEDENNNANSISGNENMDDQRFNTEKHHKKQHKF